MRRHRLSAKPARRGQPDAATRRIERVSDAGGSTEADPVAGALHALFESNVDDLFGFVFVRCGRRDLASDVVGETFAEAARVAARSGTETLTPGWLRHVAKLRLIDSWRREERHRRREERLRELRIDTCWEMGASVGDQTVVAALDSVPARQRAALAMRYLDDASLAEVAEALDITPTAAESLLARARRSFAVAYSAEEAR